MHSSKLVSAITCNVEVLPVMTVEKVPELKHVPPTLLAAYKYDVGIVDITLCNPC